MLSPHIGWMLGVAAAMMDTGTAFCADYPSKPIRLVTSELNGGSDIVARLVAQAASVNVGQQIIVENRGGSGIIPGQIVARALPDGYTLLLYGSSIWLLPLLRDDVPFERVRDFAPITSLTTSPNVLVVHPSAPAQSIKDLIALAKSKSGALNYGSGPAGTASHLTAEMFKAMAGVNIVRVPYKGMAPALVDLITGEVQLVFATAGSVAPHVKSGRLKALAVTSPRSSPLFPGIPAVAASLPGYESVSMVGLFAPVKTPTVIVSRLNHEVVQVLGSAEIKDKLLNAGVEAAPGTPQQLEAAMRLETANLGKVIKDAGIRSE